MRLERTWLFEVRLELVLGQMPLLVAHRMEFLLALVFGVLQFGERNSQHKLVSIVKVVFRDLGV